MIPEKYSVSNFKSFGKQQTLDLCPLTLLFGKNSSGKSSIIQSLLLCQHALNYGHFEFNKIQKWGQEIDLGGFQNYVHKHENNRDITFGFTFKRTQNEIESAALDSTTDRTINLTSGNTFQSWSYYYMNFIESISVEFTLGENLGEQSLGNMTKGEITHDLFTASHCIKDIKFKINNNELAEFNFDKSKGKYFHDSDMNLFPELIAAYAFAIADHVEYELDSGKEIEQILDAIGSTQSLIDEDHVTYIQFREGVEKSNHLYTGQDAIDDDLNDKMSQELKLTNSDTHDEITLRVKNDEINRLAELQISVIDKAINLIKNLSKNENIISDNKKRIVRALHLLELPNFYNAVGELHLILLQKTTSSNRSGLRITGKGLDLKVDSNESDYSANILREKNPKEIEETAQSTGTSMGLMEEINASEDPIVFFSRTEETKSLENSEFEPDPNEIITRALRFDMELVIESALESVKEMLRKFSYIGPYREIPSRIQSSVENDEAFSVMEKIESNYDLASQISKVFQDVLESPYRIEVRSVAPNMDYNKLFEEITRNASTQGELISPEMLNDTLKEVSKGEIRKDLKLVDTRTGTEVDFCDVGFGISQVLPLIALINIESNTLISVEQPEIHLHPKMQGDLGDVIAAQIENFKKSGRIFLMETHSEDMILRLLRRVRETYESIEDGDEPEIEVRKSDLSVNWVAIKNEETEIQKLQVNEEGEFDESWPEGFFDDRIKDLG